jgi:nucleotide-binding universal stress UspA family protein
MLATLDVPFSDEAVDFAVGSAVESGHPLLVVNVAEVLPTVYTVFGYGYVEREDLQLALRKPADLARSLAVQVERLRVCSPHPVEALLEVAIERDTALLVFGPDRAQLRAWRYRRAKKKICKHASCLTWFADNT